MIDTTSYPELSHFPDSDRELIFAVAKTSVAQNSVNVLAYVLYFALLIGIVALVPRGTAKFVGLMLLIGGFHSIRYLIVKKAIRAKLREYQTKSPGLAEFEALRGSASCRTPGSRNEAPAVSQVPLSEAPLTEQRIPDISALRPKAEGNGISAYMYIVPIMLLAGVVAFVVLGQKPPTPREPPAFTEHLVKRIHHESPQTTVTVLGPLQLRVEHATGWVGTVSAHKVWNACKAQDFYCDQAIGGFINTIENQVKLVNLKPTERNIFLVVRPETELAAVETEIAIKQPIVDGLFAVGVVDSGEHFRYINSRDLRQMNISAASAAEVARINLIRALDPLPSSPPTVSSPTGIGFTRASRYGSGYLALHREWAPLVRSMGGVLFATIATDQAIFYGGDHKNSLTMIEAMSQLRESGASGSRIVLKWTEVGWVKQIVREKRTPSPNGKA